MQPFQFLSNFSCSRSCWIFVSFRGGEGKMLSRILDLLSQMMIHLDCVFVHCAYTGHFTPITGLWMHVQWQWPMHGVPCSFLFACWFRCKTVSTSMIQSARFLGWILDLWLSVRRAEPLSDGFTTFPDGLITDGHSMTKATAADVTTCPGSHGPGSRLMWRASIHANSEV